MFTAVPVDNPVLDTGSKELLGALVTFLQPLILGQGKKITTISTKTTKLMNYVRVRYWSDSFHNGEQTKM